MTRRLTILGALALLGACVSPEAQRTRGGGPGADIGNRDGQLEMHEGSIIYYETPCLTTLSECNGPMPERTARRS